MGKSLFIAEKPSVAQEFAKVLGVRGRGADGFLESDQYVVTWCVGHLVTMSYPETYDPALKKWSLDTLPFLPEEFKYEVIPAVKKQFNIVSRQLKRDDVSTIYVCTDSGREGEYIYRLVDSMAGVGYKDKRRVWIDSQTEEEIKRGIREAKPLSAYDSLADAAYLRAKEDYLMGINFSRLLTLKYGQSVTNFLRTRYTVISVGRVMTCVLGMVVRREREIRGFVKTPFYRVTASLQAGEQTLDAEWKAVEGSCVWQKPVLYKDNGFKKREDAEKLIAWLQKDPDGTAKVEKVTRKTERKNPPLLYNLAELQNDSSRFFKLSPDETLSVVQELYEKKLVTYPRTDARVLSSAVAREIDRNIKGLTGLDRFGSFASRILAEGSYKEIEKSRYTDDKKITDHYAIIPTGQGMGAYAGLTPRSRNVYRAIVRRFLSIFYPPALYQKVSLQARVRTESFFADAKVLKDPGYLEIAGTDIFESASSRQQADEQEGGSKEAEGVLLSALSGLKSGMLLPVKGYSIREGETSPPKRYNSGSMILAMENAGQLIEDESLREQIKGSGIGTSATRAEILKKLFTIRYLSLNKKTQIITPTQLGEIIYDVVDSCPVRSLLNPELTASWEKGLTYVADGKVSTEEYMEKLEKFIRDRVLYVAHYGDAWPLREKYEKTAMYYINQPKSTPAPARRKSTGRRQKAPSAKK